MENFTLQNLNLPTFTNFPSSPNLEFLDYLGNSEHQNIISSFSTQTKPGNLHNPISYTLAIYTLEIFKINPNFQTEILEILQQLGWNSILELEISILNQSNSLTSKIQKKYPPRPVSQNGPGCVTVSCRGLLSL
jgi:hypothetical protein